MEQDKIFMPDIRLADQTLDVADDVIPGLNLLKLPNFGNIDGQMYLQNVSTMVNLIRSLE